MSLTRTALCVVIPDIWVGLQRSGTGGAAQVIFSSLSMTVQIQKNAQIQSIMQFLCVWCVCVCARARTGEWGSETPFIWNVDLILQILFHLLDAYSNSTVNSSAFTPFDWIFNAIRKKLGQLTCAESPLSTHSHNLAQPAPLTSLSEVFAPTLCTGRAVGFPIPQLYMDMPLQAPTPLYYNIICLLVSPPECHFCLTPTVMPYT